MTTSFKILTTDDTALCAALHRACFGEAAWSAAQIHGSLSLPTTQGWCMHVGEQPAGFILYQRPPDEIEILTFGIIPELQKHGFGMLLLQHVIRTARATGNQRIFLEVAEDNAAAIRLYQKLDFQFIGKRRGYYQRPNGPVAAYLYQLSLNEP